MHKGEELKTGIKDANGFPVLLRFSKNIAIKESEEDNIRVLIIELEGIP
jgi:hypothetical protein